MNMKAAQYFNATNIMVDINPLSIVIPKNCPLTMIMALIKKKGTKERGQFLHRVHTIFANTEHHD